MWLRSLLLLLTFLCDRISLSQAEICTNATCTYDLVIDYAWTMQYKDGNGVVHNVTLNGTSLQYVTGSEIHTVSPNDVIVADGYFRRLLLFNGQFPGPPIEVVHGAQVVVRVKNNMTDNEVTVHFHGVRQLNTWFYDGASGVTNCPIPAGGSSEYRFIADPIGTHWYHEHHRLVYSDGLYGFFVVYPKNALPSSSEPHFLVTTNDWIHQDISINYANNKHTCANGPVGASLKAANYTVGCAVDGTEMIPGSYVSALFGARGRWKGQPFPLAQYVVADGSTRRFRTLHSGIWFPLEVSVDGHLLRIVASDSGPIQPFLVNSFIIMPGERVDFELEAKQPAGRYWMRARPTCITSEVRAVLVYKSVESSDPDADPTTTPSPCTAASPCTIFNCAFERYPDGSNRTCITLDKLHSDLTSAELQETFGVGDPDSEVLTYFLNFATVVGSSINARRFAAPALPYFAQKPPPCTPVPCVDACNCQCAYTLTIPFNKTIQFVFSTFMPNKSISSAGLHNVHFHGYPFAVMSVGFPKYDPVTGYITTANDDIDCHGELCWNATWNATREQSFQSVTQPTIKDTVVVPMSGYVVARFRSTNPGPFMLHCHIDSHVVEGMAMIIDVAPGHWAPQPPGLSTCLPADFTTKASTLKTTVKTTTKKPTTTTKKPKKPKPKKPKKPKKKHPRKPAKKGKKKNH